MENMYKNVVWIFTCAMIFGISCKKLNEIPPPKSEVITSTVFADSTDATAAILGIYINMMQAVSLNICSGGLTLYCGLSSDELSTTTGNPDESGFYENAISPTNNLNFASLWYNGYNLIYSANASIEGLLASNNISLGTKNELLSEAKFCRAFLYFNLVNLYGDVPLIVSSDFNLNKTLPRASTDSVYKQIIFDLTDALKYLPVNYITSGRYRPNYYAQPRYSLRYIYISNSGIKLTVPRQKLLTLEFIPWNLI